MKGKQMTIIIDIRDKTAKWREPDGRFMIAPIRSATAGVFVFNLKDGREPNAIKLKECEDV